MIVSGYADRADRGIAVFLVFNRHELASLVVAFRFALRVICHRDGIVFQVKHHMNCDPLHIQKVF